MEAMALQTGAITTRAGRRMGGTVRVTSTVHDHAEVRDYALNWLYWSSITTVQFFSFFSDLL